MDQLTEIQNETVNDSALYDMQNRILEILREERSKNPETPDNDYVDPVKSNRPYIDDKDKQMSYDREWLKLKEKFCTTKNTKDLKKDLIDLYQNYWKPNLNKVVFNLQFSK